MNGAIYIYTHTLFIYIFKILYKYLSLLLRKRLNGRRHCSMDGHRWCRRRLLVHRVQMMYRWAALLKGSEKLDGSFTNMCLVAPYAFVGTQTVVVWCRDYRTAAVWCRKYATTAVLGNRAGERRGRGAVTMFFSFFFATSPFFGKP